VAGGGRRRRRTDAIVAIDGRDDKWTIMVIHRKVEGVLQCE